MQSVVKIQAYWRLASNHGQYRAIKIGFTLLQGQTRGWLVRRQLVQQGEKATVIQSHWRGFSASVSYRSILAAALLCQSLIRRQLADREMTHRKNSLLTIQEAARCWIARRIAYRLRLKLDKALRKQVSATTIQAIFRAQTARRQYATLRTQATKIQTHWRCFSTFIKYNLVLCDILIVQGTVRRRIAYRIYACKKRAVQTIQLAGRRWAACRRVKQIRTTWNEEARQESAALNIQSFYRGRLARELLLHLHLQTTTIQRIFRGHLANLSYQMDLVDIIISQSVVRGSIAQKKYAGKKRAVQTIQLAGRRWAACRRVKQIRTTWNEKARQESAALNIQSFYRGRLARELLLHLHLQATTIQSIFRGHLANLSYQMDLVDIIISQSVVRASIAQKQFCRQKTASVKIQSVLRGWIASRLVLYLRSLKELDHLELKSSVTIQRVWRGHVARLSSKEHSAARKIQKTWRCFDVHVDYIIQLLAVISIQSYARRFLEERSFRKATEGIIALQALARGCTARKRLKRNDHAAIVLQSAVRTYVAKSSFTHHRNAATVIQRATRGYLARVDLDVANFAACEIQRVWRGYAGFADFVISVIAIVKIQSVLRMKMAKLTLRERKLMAWVEAAYVNRQAKTIQSAFRDYLLWRRLSQATRTIQRTARAYLFRKIAGKITRGVKRLQAVARAHMLRRNRPKKVLIVVRRIDKANARAVEDPKMRLGYRTESALKVLLTSTRLSEIMSAVTTLEAATRLSIVCCEEFTRAGAADILLALIRTCNRSLPHVELLHHILFTLENVASHDSLLPGFLDPVSAEVFMDLVQMFRDKDGIFCLSIFLLNRAIICDESVKVRHHRSMIT
jgi:abnormal spindle-like microcephaly-associated protein